MKKSSPPEILSSLFLMTWLCWSVHLLFLLAASFLLLALGQMVFTWFGDGAGFLFVWAFSFVFAAMGVFSTFVVAEATYKIYWNHMDDL
jgi:hypothetical protein